MVHTCLSMQVKQYEHFSTWKKWELFENRKCDTDTDDRDIENLQKS